VREVTDLLSAIAAEKGLRFQLQWGRPLPQRVRGDAARVKQVLHNLVGNAIKFTRSGDVTLEITAAEGQLCFTVRDSGHGIAAEQAERIFDAFAQAGEAPSRRAGTGLGLTISRQLARAMGGDVRYEPAEGGGSVFRFMVAVQHLPPDPGNADESWAAHDFHLKGRVLVVDDSPVNALVARGMLERFGLRVDVAEDGEEALQRMRQVSYDAVLMDCQMPGLDGFETTQRWRRDEPVLAHGGHLPIIALTANAVPGDREHCLAAGMDDYLAKPFDLNDLGAVLQRHLPAMAEPR